MRLLCYLADVCALVHDAQNSQPLYQALLPLATYNIVAADGVACYGAASRFLGQLAMVMSRWDEADAHFQHALSMNETIGATPWLAHAKFQYASMLRARRRCGDQKQAEVLLDEACPQLQDVKRVDDICDAFEVDWLAGRAPRIEDALARSDRDKRDLLLRELLLAEWDLREKHTQPVELIVYEERFPRDHSLIGRLWHEWRATRPVTDDVLVEQLVRGTGSTDASQSTGQTIRCPHCHNLVRIAAIDSYTEVVCPTCGSSFQLEQDAFGSCPSRGDVRKVGRFELIEKVGAGAFGTVYKPRDPQLDRIVAVKVPRSAHLADREYFDRRSRGPHEGSSRRGLQSGRQTHCRRKLRVCDGLGPCQRCAGRRALQRSISSSFWCGFR